MESTNMTLTKNPNYYNISQNYTPIRQNQLKNISIKSNKIQPIAPAPPTPTSNSINDKNQQPIISSLPVVVCGYKKKYTYTNLPYSEHDQQHQPQSVVRRNARERNRVKQVNNGFATLRQHIPQSVVTSLTNGGGRGASKKLSKVDTLRIAVEYISRLQELIRNNESDSDSSTSSYHSAITTISSSNNNYDYYTECTDIKQQENYQIRSPSYSDISSSPVPSCSSEQSSIGSNQYYQMQPMVMSTPTLIQQQYKYDNTNYDQYNSSMTETTPEDEELLDYISSWQEQQQQQQ